MEWITIADYMKKFGVTRKAVEQMIEAGHLIAVPVGNRTLVKVQTEEVAEELKIIKKDLERLMKHFGINPSEQKGA